MLTAQKQIRCTTVQIWYTAPLLYSVCYRLIKFLFMWTKFFDMASGGSEKTDYAQIYIELPEDEARKYFEDKFG